MLAAILRPNLSSNDRKNVGIRSVFNGAEMKNGTLVLLSGLLLLVGCSLRTRVEPSKNPTAGRLQKLADDGDPDAQFQLGRAYFYGRGVAKDT
ncbi:MAG TPA: hypothetical protein VKB56_13205, partial [Terriglobales bacterium]|nr:hypothetical protein [Terriglobales bacterium]